MTNSLRSRSVRSLPVLVIVIALLVAPASTSFASVKYYSTSDNWAGYGAPAPTGQRFSAVFAQYYEPKVSCKKNTPNQRVLLWAGLGGTGSNPLIQVGSGIQCVGLTPRHFLWWDFVPYLQHDALITDAPFVPAPGDYMIVQVKQWTPTSMFISISDNHQGKAVREWHKIVGAPAGSADSATQSAECIVEAPSLLSAKSKYWNLPNVGTTNFAGDCQAQIADTSTSYYLAADRKQLWSESTFSPSELRTQAYRLRSGNNKLTPDRSGSGFIVTQP